jgi:hypothetical protein
MILNTQIWRETIEAAKAAASTSPAWLRAIERAVIEIEKAKYWAFDGDVLTIISTTSKKTYKIGADHTCEARGGICKHRASRRLIQRYTERLHAAPKSSQSPKSDAFAERERAPLIKREGNAMIIDGWAV